jgi:hypothetical protein
MRKLFQTEAFPHRTSFSVSEFIATVKKIIEKYKNIKGPALQRSPLYITEPIFFDRILFSRHERAAYSCACRECA